MVEKRVASNYCSVIEEGKFFQFFKAFMFWTCQLLWNLFKKDGSPRYLAKFVSG